MVAAAPRRPRGERKSEFEVHSYDNMILLCRHHHAVIDLQAGSHSVERLRTWKAEHESWVTAVTSVAGDLVPWTAIVQEDEPRTDVLETLASLGPGHRVIRLEALRSSPAQHEWPRVAAVESRLITQLLAGTPAERRRFAVFSMGRIPLAVQLGYLLGDRARMAVPVRSRRPDLGLAGRRQRPAREAIAPRTAPARNRQAQRQGRGADLSQRLNPPRGRGGRGGCRGRPGNRRAQAIGPLAALAGAAQRTVACLYGSLGP